MRKYTQCGVAMILLLFVISMTSCGQSGKDSKQNQSTIMTESNTVEMANSEIADSAQEAPTEEPLPQSDETQEDDGTPKPGDKAMVPVLENDMEGNEVHFLVSVLNQDEIKNDDGTAFKYEAGNEDNAVLQAGSIVTVVGVDEERGILVRYEAKYRTEKMDCPSGALFWLSTENFPSWRDEYVTSKNKEEELKREATATQRAVKKLLEKEKELQKKKKLPEVEK